MHHPFHLLVACSMILTTACSTGYMPVQNKKSEHTAVVEHVQLGQYEAKFFLSSGNRDKRVLMYVNLQLTPASSENSADILQKAPIHIEIIGSGKDSVSGKDTIPYNLIEVRGPQKIQDIQGEHWIYLFLATGRRRFDRIVRITLSVPSKDGGKPAIIQKSFLMKHYRHFHLLS